MSEPSFESASGLRPVAAFVLIVTVLLAVAVKASFIAVAREGEQPDQLREERDPRPSFMMLDREGRPLGMSIECFDLTMSPQATWRAHTPERMAAAIADVLGDVTAAELLPRMFDPEPLPEDSGCFRVARPDLLLFDEVQAGKVMRWIRAGIREGDRSTRIEGLHLVRHAVLGRYTLEWEPAVLLSKAHRSRHLEVCADQPSLWTRHLLDDLAQFVDAERVAAEEEARTGRTPTRAQLAALLRDRIWQELMPCQYRVVARRIDPVASRTLDRLLRDEAVSVWQMKLEPCLDRRHPTRPASEDVGPVAEPRTADAFPILGAWGVLGEAEARALAMREHGLEPDQVVHDPALAASIDERAHLHQTEYRPWSGLELACYTELARPRWREALSVPSRGYLRRERIVPRDRQGSWRAASQDGRFEVPDYFQATRAGGEPPRVVSTLDAELQTYLHERLRETRQANAAAVAMGIVVDVASGDVLAVDASLEYPYSAFAPLRHAFTPGSTFKVPIMAVALDSGAVRPDDRFATYAGVGVPVIDPTRGTMRRIKEAEGAPREPEISAAQGLARSVNAVLVQVGLQLPAADLRARLARLGYGQSAGANLGPESGGYLPPLKQGTWSRIYTHASVCFGHEVATTLWQHASALSTIARGGVRRPLRLIRAVEYGGRRYELEPEAGERVMGAQACADVRDMMRLGAREGTGEPVAGPDHCPEFDYIGTKTGTTEKVSSELCVHVELEHQAAHAAAREADPHAPGCDRACRASLRGVRAHDRQSCYTCSMLSIGRLAGSERELLVLVVVDGPRGKAHFGREVSGECNIDVLRHAFGLESLEVAREGRRERDAEPSEDVETRLEFNRTDLPWIETAAREGDFDVVR